MSGAGLARARRAAVAVGVIALAAIVGLAVWNLMRPEIEISVEQSSGDSATEFHNTQIVARRQGEKIWSLTAGTLRQDGDHVHIDGVEDGTLYRDGKAYASLAAKTADWDRKSGQVIFAGDVELRYQTAGAKTAVIKSARLVWNDAAQSLTSPGRVVLTDDDRTLSADRMVADTVAKTVRLAGHVLLEGKGLHLELGAVLYHTDTQSAELFGSLGGEIPVDG